MIQASSVDTLVTALIAVLRNSNASSDLAYLILAYWIHGGTNGQVSGLHLLGVVIAEIL